MNLLHLKYAVEIAECASMTKAAERLYTAQPNLSRAMRELETSLGITVFKRTAKGISVTPEGEEFIGYAKKILDQVDAIEAMYSGGKKKDAAKFSISVPRASYISCAFTDFVRSLSGRDNIELFYKETNSYRAVNNITEADYKLGILRYRNTYEPYFSDMLRQKNLAAEKICDFRYVLIMSKNSSLAQKKQIAVSDLDSYTELAHADPFVPSLPLSIVRRGETVDNVKKHIYIFERASQMDILSETTDTFMWVSPVPSRLLDRYGLVERECGGDPREYRDVVISREDYRYSDLDAAFMRELDKYRDELFEASPQK